MSKNCIIMITKDRPHTLEKTVSFLHGTSTEIILIDDSTTRDTQRMISNNYWETRIVYHGRNEQKKLMKPFSDFEPFIKPLGQNAWNLGFIRNYALVVAKKLAYDQILFMDDDIIVRDAGLIEKAFHLLNAYDFVGTSISGMPDDSVTGHLMRACNGEFYDFLAGGFIAFDINKVSEYFVNFYNEDQIWLFLHNPGTRFKTFGEVEQQQYDPFKNAWAKAISQEFGEILNEGAEEAFKLCDHSLLLMSDFWSEICENRMKYVSRLLEFASGNAIEQIAIDVHQALSDYHATFSRNDFVSFFETYFHNREIWQSFLRE